MVDGVSKDVKEVKVDLASLSKEFSSTVIKVNAMNNTMEKFMNEKSQNQSKIDNIFQVHQLKISDYVETDEKPRKSGRVTKWVNVRNKAENFAFKSISEREVLGIVRNRVTILKELHNFQNIIKFYGLTTDGNKWYLVTEWAEYGNLREFYTNHKNRFDLGLKLRVACDVARGSNFLRTVEVIINFYLMLNCKFKFFFPLKNF